MPDEKTQWSTRWHEYSPHEHTDPKVLDNDITKMDPVRCPGNMGWADPPIPTEIDPEEWRRRFSFEGDLVFGRDGRPRNPRGRTGMVGRGLLGKWGPNHAADPIVTRYNPARPSQLQMVAIKRRDTGDWAIPGGMVDAGETVSVTVKREFMEEAGNLPQDQREGFKKLIDELFEGGSVVYQGYVDDPRNTDNAWIETTAFHFHCDDTVGTKIKLKSGDDAQAVMWLSIDKSIKEYQELYASHREWVDGIARRLDAQRLEESDSSAQPSSPGGEEDTVGDLSETSRRISKAATYVS